MQPMTPWYKGFKGRIEQKPGGFESVGIINKIDHETLEITELPVKVWTQVNTALKRVFQILCVSLSNQTALS